MAALALPAVPAAGLTVHVVHAIPGRLRLRVPALRAQPALAERLLAAGMAHVGVRAVRVNLACASVVVEYDPAAVPEAELRNGLVQRWLTARDAARQVASEESRGDSARRLAPLALAAGGLALALAAGPASPLAVAATLAGAVPIIGRALRTLLRERRPSVDQLDASALGLMLVLGDVRAAAIMTTLIALGEEIRDRTARRSQRAALDLHGALGRRAWLVRGAEKVKVPVEQLQVGDVVAVYPGDLIPVDGVIVDGAASVDQKTLTGESHAVLKQRGERVLAATVVSDGKLYVCAEAVGSSTRAGWIVRALQEAPRHDTRAANHAARFADRLVLPTFALAGLSFAATRSLAHAASILIVDFATGIRVSAPTCVLATMTRAAGDGVLIKGGRAIEQLAAVDAILFDKTGTLTRGEPVVSDVLSLDGRYSADDLLALAAAAEIRLRHPAARAVVRQARARHLHIPERHSSHYTPGMGVLARVNGYEVHVGSARFLAAEGIDTGPADAPAAELGARGRSIVLVALDGRPVGLIAHADPLRPESVDVIRWLRAQGVREILMVSGDDPAAAHGVAAALGIEEVHAGALPEQKAAIVERLRQRDRVVAVVGDGINDSPALSRADVSIALSHGADVARETADLILVEPTLWGLPRAIHLSRQCVGIIRQNLYLVAAPNAAALALATAGGLGTVGSTIINNGSTMVAGINSLRPLRHGSATAMPDERSA